MQSPRSLKTKTVDKSSAQTLDRGIRVLEVLADAHSPLNVATLAARLEVDRTVVYRLLRTLADHRLVTKDSAGLIRLGTGLLSLSSKLSGDIQAASASELASLASDLGATAFITIEDVGEAVCLAAAEPRHTDVHIAYRAGQRHPLDQGASSIALLAGRPPVRGERPEIRQARIDGYAVSHAEVQSGTVAVGAPVRPGDGEAVASVAVVALTGAVDIDAAIERVVRASETIARALS